MAAEPIDLGELAADIEENYPQRVMLSEGQLHRPELGAALRAFGPGTTVGGRAEAGWHMLGRIADDGLTLGNPRREPRRWPASPVPTSENVER